MALPKELLEFIERKLQLKDEIAFQKVVDAIEAGFDDYLLNLPPLDDIPEREKAGYIGGLKIAFVVGFCAGGKLFQEALTR
jgi:hypothetical protein